MSEAFNQWVAGELAALRAAGLEKPERVITTPQGAEIGVRGQDAPVINLCSNNYLGLAGDARVVDAAIEATRRWGAGLASVRFICGTQEIHKQLETAIAAYVGHEDAILFAAAFDANGGVFEPLLGEADAIVSDALNHASIIDGVRLSKARRHRFANGDLDELEERLKAARAEGARTILIATDGVFSMDGHIADLAGVRALADRHDALILVDDCHATGFIGPLGRGTPALAGVGVDIVTGTFGKALGGAMGGFIAASADVVALLRQRARPYLFSNALAPAVCGASLAAIAIAQGSEGDALRARLDGNARRLRAGLTAAGFTLVPGRHPITPVMLGEAALAQRMAARLLEEGVFVTGFSFPVVPHGQARIRAQVSAAHGPEQVDRAVAAFTRVGRELGVVA
jgi:glycine C-acetyltransferase